MSGHTCPSFGTSASIKDGQPFYHNIQLYLADAYGIQVPDTEFWVTLTLIKEGSKVTVQIPAINFQTGPYANSIYETANPISGEEGISGVFLPPPQNGGYLYTLDGFLPKELRPNDVLNLSYFAGSNNGNNIAFSYLGSPPTDIAYTPPAPGYLLQVTNAGALVVQGLGTFANIIPPGTQNVLPTTFTYIIKPKISLEKNTRISTGAINTAVFPPTSSEANDALRDSHVNDAFDNVVAYAWTDNSNVPDQAVNFDTIHLAAAIGKVKGCELKMHPAVFIPTPDHFYIFDTAIAINRTNSKNIVISWELNTFSPVPPQPFGVLYRAVSFDGGKTWPINGPTNIQPTGFIAPGIPGGGGDVPGIKADKFGNFWYVATNFFDDDFNEVNIPFIMVSSDGGVTFTLVYTAPSTGITNLYDFPQFCFGGDGQGNYGIHLVVDYFPGFDTGSSNGYPYTVFIPITGLGTYGTAQATFLPQLLNNIFTASITASEDGRVWTMGSPAGLGPAAYPFPGSAITSLRTVFKSPGPIDQNYAGPWDVAIYNFLADSIFIPTFAAQPVFGFFQTVQNNIYDDKRQALYVIFNAHFPDNSQNTRIYLRISRNNGQTWSNPIDISNSDLNNRGFQSMALDTVTGNLSFGWYDGRNYEDGTSLNYYGTVLDAKNLDKLVEQLPLANPLYSIPANTPPPPTGPVAPNALKPKSVPRLNRHAKRIATVKANISK